VEYEGRNGTQSQSYLAGFADVENEINVHVEVRHGDDGVVVRQVTNLNVNRVKVRVMIPSLYSTSAVTGDTSGTELDIALYVKPTGGSYALMDSRHVSGKSSGK